MAAKNKPEDVVEVVGGKTILPVDDIIPYKNNPRNISAEAVEVVKQSIEKYGMRQPIVVDKDNVVIAGHTRLQACIALGMTAVWVERADDLTPEQVRAYRIVDNRSNEFSGWDIDLLSLEVKDLENIELPGFEDDELESLRALDPNEPPPPAQPGGSATQRQDRSQYAELKLFVPAGKAKKIKERFVKILRDDYGMSADREE